jgi:hypothetical protein
MAGQYRGRLPLEGTSSLSGLPPPISLFFVPAGKKKRETAAACEREKKKGRACPEGCTGLKVCTAYEVRATGRRRRRPLRNNRRCNAKSNTGARTKIDAVGVAAFGDPCCKFAPQYQFCHCESVLTLAWQSASPVLTLVPTQRPRLPLAGEAVGGSRLMRCPRPPYSNLHNVINPP